MYVPQTATKAEVAKHQEVLEERLDLLTMQADDYFR
jgi:hypothetical protein